MTWARAIGHCALAASVFLCSVRASPVVSQAQTFSAEVVGVRLDVSVRDANGVVAGLAAKDFEVFDNGAKQSCSVIETSDAPLDLMFVVQPLPLPRPDQLSVASAAASSLGSALTPEDRVGVVVASSGPELLRPLAPADAALASLRVPMTGTGAAVRDALMAAFLQFDHTDRRKAVVVFTDGRHDESWITPAAIAATGLYQPAEIVIALLDASASVAVETVESVQRPTGERVTTTELRPGALRFQMPPPPYWAELARATGGELVDLRRGNASARLRELVTALRSQYVITYTPSGGKATGWHEVRVKLKGHKGTVVTRSGYYSGGKR